MEKGYKPILETHSQADIAMIKSVLDSEKIDYWIKDEMFNVVRPLVQPVVLMVKEEQIEKAKEVLKQFNIQT